MPETQNTPNSPDAFLRSPHAVGIFALLMLGIAMAFVVFSLLDIRVAQRAQTSAAATTSDPFTDISIEAKSAIVVDLTTGKTLYELNPDAQLPLASLTKVPLILVVSSSLPADAVITIPYDTAPKGSAQRLAKGERWKVSDVINFTLIASSNEGAKILASAADAEVHAQYPASPLVGATLWRMNDLAKQLGLSHTYFLNVSGLDESLTQSGAYGSARDVEAIFAYAASTSYAVFAGTAKDGLLLTDEQGGTTSAFNTNEALGKIPGLIMGKTGFTDLAGGNLAVVFDIGLAHPVVAVVLGSSHQGRFTDIQKLVTAARDAVTQ
ncbi:MAG: serine hydrolase [Candidatus Paceibacterota bacterium]